MDLKVAGEDFHFDKVAPILITNVPAGEVEIEVQLLDAEARPLAFKSGAKSSFDIKAIARTPFFKNDAIVFGILLLILGLIFWTSGMPVFKTFYKYVPALLLCYFLPSFLNSGGLISGDYSNLYYVASRYLLPASLILLCISIDFKGIMNLGPKALIMFFAATLGIIIGGPIALLAILKFAPHLINADPVEVANGLSTIAGSWIGGGANQTAMKEIFEVKDQIFSSMVIVDVVVANIWMGFLLYGAGITDKLDTKLKADSSAIKELQKKVGNYRSSIEKIPTTRDVFTMMAVAFGGVALSHWLSQLIVGALRPHRETLKNLGLQSLNSSFFWLIVIATTYGLLLALTKARKLEGVGASRWGSVFIYILVATIGMKMDLISIFQNLGLFAVGIIWMIIHISVLLLVAKLIKAPFFFVAVGSQANIGGAASAPIVASAFSPSLAPVGVLMAVLGYALGTYGAIICAYMMRAVAAGF
ncbi:MAG TPA: DUF819 family protein [Saprospiraceae bacterium]|nr:DUF819 family protein [Saprospiraceae bacterium]